MRRASVKRIGLIPFLQLAVRSGSFFNKTHIPGDAEPFFLDRGRPARYLPPCRAPRTPPVATSTTPSTGPRPPRHPLHKDARLRRLRARPRSKPCDEHPIRLLAYCLMPNHWHLVLWPATDGELSPSSAG